ncbi:hypothetical protein [Chryseobacterium limigenitum]|uniref:Uncharacterized protein n=1 Tax=Chryseobacterium limigenitum TaxID=1612149 RepID=A0A1K2IUZ4_9FLAO|nr:hypothetical protein [Chryseobacterium limigenitum]SFZ96090.1 hypothetical protein SAMN05216324_11586 [Chryseobacterium limigenitum]
MKKIKRAYYYFYYKIYKSIVYTSEMLGGQFLTDFKTIIAIGTLEIWLLLSIGNYFLLITEKSSGQLTIQQPIVFIPLTIIFVLNYFSFIHIDVWKKYNKEFDELPEELNKKGGIIVWSLVALVVINLIFSYYLLFERAKKNHTGPYSKEYIESQRIKDSISDVNHK